MLHIIDFPFWADTKRDNWESSKPHAIVMLSWQFRAVAFRWRECVMIDARRISMTRAFRYLGREWQASNPPTTAFQYADLDVIDGTSAPPTVAPSLIRLVEFRCVSCQPEWKYESTDLNVADASEAQLVRTLESAL